MSEEFLQMILEYENDLHRRAMSLYKGDESDSADLVQDTVLKALKNEDKFEKGTNLRAWLLTILYHLFVNRHRRNKKFDEICDKHKSFTTQTSVRDAYTTDPIAPIEMESILKLLKSQLDDIFYDVLLAVDVEDLSYKEASSRLDIPVGTVMSRLYRARRKSREVLVELYDNDILEAYLGKDALIMN